MDDPVPTIDFSPAGSSESPYELQRTDIDGETAAYHVFVTRIEPPRRSYAGPG